MATVAFDAVGNPVSTTKASGTATAAVGDATVATTFDKANRPTAVNFSDSTPDLTRTYDTAGQLTSTTAAASGTAPAQSATYAYDPVGHLAGITRAGGTDAYTHTPAGRLQTATWAGGSSASYTYDYAGRPAGMTPSTATSATPASSPGELTYAYDPAGNLLTVTRPGGPSTTATYDANGALATLKHLKGTTALVDYALTRDALGRPTRVTSARGGAVARTTSYGYDTQSRLTSWCQPQSGTTCAATSAKGAYTYDKVGNRTAATLANTTGSGAFTYTYDQADRLTQTRSGTTVASTYTYDRDGQQVSEVTSAGTRTHTWRLDGNLAAVTLPTGQAVTYGYDTAGNRTTRAVGGVVDRGWSWDTSSSLAQRRSETDGAGRTVHAWVLDPLSPTGSAVADLAPSTAGAPVLTWLLSDPFASVTDTATGAGLTGTGVLNPFGDPRAGASGSVLTQPLRHHGQYLDAVTGVYDIRARDYHAGTGRFLAQDPVTAPVDDPVTSGYAYGFNNPLVHIDPTGQWPSKQGLTNFAAGALDGATLGASRWVRDKTGIGPAVDYSSGAYLGGMVTGTVALGVVSGGAGAAVGTALGATKAGLIRARVGLAAGKGGRIAAAARGAVGGVVNGAGSYTANTLAAGQPLSAAGVAASAAYGGAGGAAGGAAASAVTRAGGELLVKMRAACAAKGATTGSKGGAGVAAEAGTGGSPVAIGKVDDLMADGAIGPGERTLLDRLPDLGSPRANWGQNSGVLRQEMRRGMPIRDASVDPVTGQMLNNTGFLRAERYLLQSRGWMFDPKSTQWLPPGR